MTTDTANVLVGEEWRDALEAGVRGRYARARAAERLPGERQRINCGRVGCGMCCFCPSTRTPSATSSEMAVALRSIRTRTTVPSRIRRVREIAHVPRVPVAFDLAPHAAHRILGNRAPEQRGKRAPH